MAIPTTATARRRPAAGLLDQRLRAVRAGDAVPRAGERDEVAAEAAGGVEHVALLGRPGEARGRERLALAPGVGLVVRVRTEVEVAEERVPGSAGLTSARSTTPSLRRCPPRRSSKPAPPLRATATPNHPRPSPWCSSSAAASRRRRRPRAVRLQPLGPVVGRRRRPFPHFHATSHEAHAGSLVARRSSRCAAGAGVRCRGGATRVGLPAGTGHAAPPTTVTAPSSALPADHEEYEPPEGLRRVVGGSPPRLACADPDAAEGTRLALVQLPHGVLDPVEVAGDGDRREVRSCATSAAAISALRPVTIGCSHQAGGLDACTSGDATVAERRHQVGPPRPRGPGSRGCGPAAAGRAGSRGR